MGEWMVEPFPSPPRQHVSALSALGCEVVEPALLGDTWIGPEGDMEDTCGEAIAALIKAM